MSFLNTPKKFWKQIFIGQESNEGEGRWVTIHGNHIFIKEGESIEDAIQKRFGITYENKPMMIVGYVGQTRILATHNVHPEVIQAVKDTLPKTVGHELIKEVRIFDHAGKQFQVSEGKYYNEAGHFDPKDFSIHLYDGDKRETATYIRNTILPHEVAHAVFDKEWHEYQTNKAKISYTDIYNTLVKHGAIGYMTGNAKEITDDNLEKLNKELKEMGYPKYKRGMDSDKYLDKVNEHLGTKDYEMFMRYSYKEGGVTGYADDWLKAWKKGKASDYNGFTENFAEIAAIKTRGGPEWEINVKQQHPKTLKYWERIVNKYSKT